MTWPATSVLSLSCCPFSDFFILLLSLSVNLSIRARHTSAILHVTRFVRRSGPASLCRLVTRYFFGVSIRLYFPMCSSVSISTRRRLAQSFNSFTFVLSPFFISLLFKSLVSTFHSPVCLLSSKSGPLGIRFHASGLPFHLFFTLSINATLAFLHFLYLTIPLSSN